mmetsp:Transcript_23949/g.28970  ORF Transcript_23949/g.28970 Transcript_23949/m.28970 type:complete len:314 (+) Transcript_23949:365-1306(+)
MMLQGLNLSELAVREEPGLQVIVSGGDATITTQVLLLPPSYQPLVINDANLILAPLSLTTLPTAVPHVFPGVVRVLFLHGPVHFPVNNSPILRELGIPPGLRPEHGMTVSLCVVVTGRLGVTLQADAQEQMSPGNADKLLHDSVNLFGVDVLKNISAVNQVKGIIFVGQVGQNTGLDVALLQHIRALLLEHRTRELNTPSALAVITHQANQGAVTSACIENGVELNLVNDVGSKAASPAALARVSTLGPSLVIKILIGVTAVNVSAPACRRNISTLRSKEKLILNERRRDAAEGWGWRSRTLGSGCAAEDCNE